MEGTRATVLEEIRTWSSNESAPQVLWLNDVTGSGKSTVAKQMAREWKGEGRLAGRFFFSRDAEETRTSKLVFTTVAQQGLSHINFDIRSALAAGIRKLLDPLSATLEEQCMDIFIGPLRVLRMQVILVLDALDECDPQACQQILHTLLPHLAMLPHLKLFLTSRPETHIRKILKEYGPLESSLRSNKSSNLHDVDVYMRKRFQKCSISEDQCERLIERAGGLFIWAKTVCDLLDNLRGNKNAFVERVISQKLRQMDPIYHIALEQAIGKNDEEESVEAYMDVLKVVVAAYEPLSPDSINGLLGISDAMEIVNDLRSVLECPGVNDVVRFLHPTFREFLLNSQVSGRYHVEIGAAHERVAGQCLFVMDKDLEYDICKLFESTLRNYTPRELEELYLRHTSMILRYACSFWGNHVTPNMVNDPLKIDLVVSIDRFFTAQLLNWIYMISLQGSNDKVLYTLQKLASVQSVSYFTDAVRFHCSPDSEPNYSQVVCGHYSIYQTLLEYNQDQSPQSVS
jgi:hypothetical protein